MFMIALLINYRLEGHQEPGNEGGSLSPTISLFHLCQPFHCAVIASIFPPSKTNTRTQGAHKTVISL